MIALLRRLRSTAGEIRAAEWMLLTIETVAVVGGILIAFELEQWAEDRREARSVERLLERMLEETRGSVTHYEFHSRQDSEKLSHAQANAMSFAQGRCPADFSRIEEVDSRVSDPPRSAALTELIEVVGLSAIPDENLKNALSGYHYANGKFYSNMDRFQREMRPVIARDDRRRLIALDSDVASQDNHLTSMLTGTPQLISATYDRERLCEDEAFKQRYLASTQQLLEVNAMRLDMLILSLRVCEQIAERLGQECLRSDERRILSDERIRELDAHVERLLQERETMVEGATR